MADEFPDEIREILTELHSIAGTFESLCLGFLEVAEGEEFLHYGLAVASYKARIAMGDSTPGLIEQKEDLEQTLRESEKEGRRLRLIELEL